MALLPFLMLIIGCVIAVTLAARKGLLGSSLDQRLNRLEAEVKRLSDQDTRLGLDDEVRRLDEKVEFLENLLAERTGTGALPPGGVEESRRAPRKA
ncbi:MAG: hypothetical protein F4087_12990 [Gemmatimonadetes bacterium]|nr:hypothetical protein [Gemmatimonadota bacterium]MYE70267.1 hypothetical protein [Gemmatimonadota bacterium]MYJ69404.1 hypothetical protein [Gemmatimonadota bacterium]